jgi:hypothetical protein
VSQQECSDGSEGSWGAALTDRLSESAAAGSADWGAGTGSARRWHSVLQCEKVFLEEA